MSTFLHIQQKIHQKDSLPAVLEQWRAHGDRIVFTNGCFDLLHFGHLHYLADARDLGERLVVGMNSSLSVSRLKGPHRPINDEFTRTHLMASLEVVDAVILFEEDTPYKLIQLVQPDILVKGGDWSPDQIVGSDIVLARGGQVLSLPFISGYSTTKIEQKILGRTGLNR